MSGRLRQYLSTHWKAALTALLLFGVTLWIFWPATGYDFLNFDDDRYVSENLVVRQGLTGEGIRWASRAVYEGYWLPVMWLSYMLDSSIFGTQPFGYHFTNVLLHALNAALVFLLLNGWTRRLWLSVFVAALFAWHPLRVESVAWIAERKDVLSGLFFLLCLLSYTRFSRNPGTGREVPAAIFMALGLLTKPMLVTVPFLLLLLDYWPLQRWSLDRASVRARAWGLFSEKVLFWALALLFCYVTYYTQTIGNAVHGTDAYPWLQRIAHLPAAYAFYLEKTILPIHLSMIYGDLHVTPLRATAAVLVLLGLTAGAWWAARRSRAPLVGWLWFLGLLVPVIGFVRVGVTHVADRFTYLPSIGLAIAVAWAAACLLQPRRWVRVLLCCIAAGILAGCVWQTREVLPRWTNSISAFESVLRVLPNHGLANNNYGEALLSAGRAEEALRHFEKAIEADRNTTPFIANAALAMVLLQRTDEAIVRLDRALVEKDPHCPFLNFIMGLSWMEKGKPARATPYLKKANQGPIMRPTWRIELARAYLESGRTAEASNVFALVASRGWGHLTDFEGMCNYYAALWQKGHGRRAWSFFEQAVATHSNNIALLNNVAWFLATDPPAGAAPDEALRLALRARDLCEVVPPNILDTVAAAYAANGDFDEAVRWADEAHAVAASNNLAVLAARIDEHRRAYRQGKAWGRTGPAAHRGK